MDKFGFCVTVVSENRHVEKIFKLKALQIFLFFVRRILVDSLAINQLRHMFHSKIWRSVCYYTYFLVQLTSSSHSMCYRYKSDAWILLKHKVMLVHVKGNMSLKLFVILTFHLNLYIVRSVRKIICCFATVNSRVISFSIFDR